MNINAFKEKVQNTEAEARALVGDISNPTHIGISLILMGSLFFVAVSFQESVYSTIVTVTLIAGLAVGLGISFYAMIKYNKGIF